MWELIIRYFDRRYIGQKLARELEYDQELKWLAYPTGHTQLGKIVLRLYSNFDDFSRLYYLTGFEYAHFLNCLSKSNHYS